MKIKELLHSPPPPHVFAIMPEGIAYARHNRHRDALERVELEPLAAPCYELGPVGVLQVDRVTLAEALGRLLPRLGKVPRRASLVVPNAWVRSVVVEVESLPRSAEEADEVVRWRLKRLLPCRPEDVRIDYLPTGVEGKLLVVLALEKPLAVAEEVFTAAGVHVGRLEPASLALTALLPHNTTSPMLLVQLERAAMALVLVREGRRVLVRNKVLPDDVARAVTFVGRELERTLAHAQAEGNRPVEVWLASPSHPLAASVERFVAEAGVTLRAMAVDPRCVPGRGEEQERLWPLLACAWHGEAA